VLKMNRIALFISIILVFPYLIYAQELSPARVKEINKAIGKLENSVKSQSSAGATEAEKEILQIGKDATPAMIEVISDKKKDNAFRRRAIQAAAKLKDETVVSHILSFAEDKNIESYHRVEAIRNIGILADELKKENKTINKKYMTNLENIFEDTQNSVDVREEAIINYGKIGQNNALPKLIEKLDDPKEEIRTNAVYGIGAVRTPEGEDALLQGFSKSKGTFLEGTYVHLFGFYKIKKATVYVMESLMEIKGTTNKNRATKKGYFDTLGELGDTTAIDTLIGYTQSKDLLEASYAASALCKIGDIRAKDAVESVIKRAEAEDRNWLLEGQPYSKDHIALRARYQKLISK